MKNYYIPIQNYFRFVSNALFVLCFLFLTGITANAQITTNSGSGLAPSYTSLSDAITALNSAAITSPVVITVNPSSPQTAPIGGYVISAQGTAVNTITLNGGGNTVTASAAQVAGSLNDAIIKIIGGDYITIQNFTLLEDAANSTTLAGTNNMTEFGIALFYASDTNGAQNNTIQNNTITLKRTYQNSFGIYSNTRHTATSMTVAADITNVTGANSFNKVYANTISNVNYGTVFIGSGALTVNGFMDNGTDIGGSSAATGNTYTNWGGIGVAVSGYVSLTGSNYCIFVNNTYNDNISYNSITSAAGTSGITTGGIYKNYSSGATVQPTGTITATISNNTVTITNSPSTVTLGSIIGIRNEGLTFLATATVNMTNNTVQNCVLGGTTTTTAGLSCIQNLSAAGTVNMTSNSVINNAITAVSSTSALISGIVNAGAGGTVNITNNIVRGMSNSATTTGQFQGIVNSGAVVTAVNINNNQLGNASGGLYSSSAAANAGAAFVIINAGAAATCALSIQNNDLRGVTLTNTLATSYYFINIQGANSPLTQNISNNTFTNLSINTTGTVYLISNYASVAIPAGGSQTISGNSIVGAFNKTVSSANSVVGIYSANTGTPNVNVTSTWNNNNFSNISVVGATVLNVIVNADTGLTNRSITNNTVNNITGGTGGIIGIAIQNGGGNGGQGNVVSGNTVSNITNDGSVSGISSFLSTLTSIYKNKIYGLSGTNAASTVSGISVNSGTTNTIYNNLVGNLTAPNANAANAVIGLNISAGTTVNAYFNTVYLNASSTGALFGSSAISASTTVNLTLNNNIFVNNSTIAGAGLAVAYRRSDTTLSTYQAGSNNNLFASNTNIYTDGTNTDATVALYKVRVAPSDSTSFTETPNFLSTVGSNANFLHINPAIATLIESGGIAISGILDDYDGNTRSGTPDVGADEFTGILITLCSGAIGGNAVGNLTNCGPATNPTITASGFSSGAVSTYQWFSSTNSSNYPASGTAVGGQTNPASLSAGTISVTTYYWLRVTCNSGTATAYSNLVTVTITPIPAAPTGLECWETATLNTGTCTWVVTETQPTEPTVINTTLLSEGFDNITTLPGAGWSQINTSLPLGTTGWFQGGTLPSQSGAATSSIGANFNNVTGDNTISNWLITPQATLQNGDVIKFWTRTATVVSFPDRLQVRLSTTGAGTNPVGPTGLGSYTTLLLDINPTYTLTGYPSAYTQYSVTVSGLSGPTTSRVALRYFVENGGPAGDNSDIIAIDTFSITRTADLACNESFEFNNTTCVWELVTGPPCESIVNLKLFIEGYYLGGGLMNTVQNNQDFPDYLLPPNTNVETITVELRDAVTTAIVDTTTSMLQTDGTAVCSFPTAPSGSYYIAVKTRSTVQTWSKLPQTVGPTPLDYDFTTAATQAFDDNQAFLATGVYGFFSGDIDSNGAQDDEVGPSDYSEWEADANALLFGSYPTDLNGDGEVGPTDYSLWETNANNFVFALYPAAP